MSDQLSHLHWRYATKQFDPTRRLDDHQLFLLKESLRLSPSSMGLQPWKFILVEDASVRKQIADAAWGQAQVTQASHLFVLTSRTTITQEHVSEFVDYAAKVQQTSVESLQGLTDMLMGFISGKDADALAAWSARQLYIALGMLLSTAALLKIDACPMEGFDTTAVDEILGLEELGFTSRALVAVGYRDEKDSALDRPKVRFPEEKVFVTIEMKK